MFLPTNLAMFYPPDARPATALMVVLLCGLIGLTVFAVLLRRPQRRLVFTGLAVVSLGMLIAVVGFVHSGSQAYADRYSYLPSIGLSLALVWPIMHLVEHRRAPFVIVAADNGFARLSGSSMSLKRRCFFWQNTEVLYSYARSLPFRIIARRSSATGGHYEEIRNLLDKAIPYYVKALTIQEEGFSLFHLGRIHLRKHNLDGAQKCFERALLYAPDRPEVNRALGRLCDERNESQKAARLLHRAAVAGAQITSDALRDFAWMVAV